MGYRIVRSDVQGFSFFFSFWLSFQRTALLRIRGKKETEGKKSLEGREVCPCLCTFIHSGTGGDLNSKYSYSIYILNLINVTMQIFLVKPYALPMGDGVKY